MPQLLTTRIPDIRGKRRKRVPFVVYVHHIVLPLCIIGYITSGSRAIAEDDGESVSVPRGAIRHRFEHARNASWNLRSDVKLVLVPLTVTDPFQRPVQGLSRKNFRIFDQGVEQKISEFSSEDAPVSVGIVFDASNSMRKKIDESRQAMHEFLRMSTPGDEFSIVKFSDRPENICSFTTDVDAIERNLAFIQTGGWTSLYDALYLAMHRMKQASTDTKALLVFSDGGDNNSRYTEREIKSMVRELDVRIFSVSILDRSPSLERISEESGGRAYHVSRLSELPNMAATLSAEIHSHYVLGYFPAQEQNDGKYHKVIVKLIPPDSLPRLRVAWRHGYYAPLR